LRYIFLDITQVSEKKDELQLIPRLNITTPSMYKYLILLNSALLALLFASVASVAPVTAAEVEEGNKSEKEIPLLSEVKHPATSAQALTQGLALYFVPHLT
jgi:hypothetical protein